MKLSNQAMGALMMVLQKCLMEETDIVPLLHDMNFQVDPADSSHSTLVVTNPPVVNFDGVEPRETEETTGQELEETPLGDA